MEFLFDIGLNLILRPKLTLGLTSNVIAPSSVICELYNVGLAQGVAQNITSSYIRLELQLVTLQPGYQMFLAIDISIFH